MNSKVNNKLLYLPEKTYNLKTNQNIKMNHRSCDKINLKYSCCFE